MKHEIGLLVLRLAFGGTMLFAHGLPKLMNFSNYSTQFPDPLGAGPMVSLVLAVFAEVFCAAAVVFGVFTRWAVVPLFITMLVAFFIVHGADPWQKKELAFIYMSAYAGIFFLGGGSFSLEKFLRK